MLPPNNRLKKKKDFEKVFKQGKGLKKDFLFFKWTDNNLEQSRFGFVVGKKFSKKAVLRNKIKRRIKKIVGNKVAQIKKGIDGVFVVNPGLKTDSFQKIEQIVNEILNKAKLLEKND